MPNARVSGILLHLTSLPGRFGIGELGREAHAFADFLAAAGQRLWQVLPLGPTGYGDSPYQCFSAFAGNPLLISLEALADAGLLSSKDLETAPEFPGREVDYGRVIEFKQPLLQEAFSRFESGAAAAERAAFEEFCARSAGWLEDYALFMALKQARGGSAWNTWERNIATREPRALEGCLERYADEVRSQKFQQYQFFKQWGALREHCRARHVSVMGDIPIFVAHDSADVWAHPELFHLAADGTPAYVAGVPPDYFSATGQLWGNPLYRWDVIGRTGYRFWIERLRATLAMVDVVRLDHFRGFEAYWEIPGKATTAVNGRWVEGPGAALFVALKQELGELPLVAEDLGVITPAVDELRQRFGFPGMAILQFAFGSDPQGPGFRPYNYTRDRVVYTGTHDNDTTVGWWTSGAGDTTRNEEDVRKERDFALKYLDAEGRDIHWAFIRCVLASVADTAVVPLQDVLGEGSESRMNVPSRAAGNWRWRYREDQLSADLRDRLKELTVLYGRAERRPDQA